MADFVNYPPHYTAYKGLEIIDLTEQMNFNRGNAVKYIARAGLKGESLEKEIEDLEKAVWYIRREIKRIAWATAEKELKDELDACEISDVMELDGDNWCWNCDKSLDRCACKKGNEGPVQPPKSIFCPHFLKPSTGHLANYCESTRMTRTYDLEKFDPDTAHYIARRNVQWTMDEIMAEVLDMVDVNKTATFILSTYEVSDEG